MTRKVGISWLAALALLAAVEPAHAQSNAAAEERTIWDGVYTDAQASRGERAARQNCGSCHSPADWSNARFIISWAGQPIRALHSELRATMPFDSPGRLTREQYADIVAYMLKLNNVPAGSEELPSDDDGLQKIGVTRQGS